MNISKISVLTAAMLGTLGQAWAADTTAPTVTASVPSGEYTSVQKIQLTVKDTSDTAPKVYYTTNGDTPTTSSTLYTSGKTFKVVDKGIARDLFLRTLAVDKSGNSRRQSFIYYITSAPTVTPSKSAGTYSSAQSVTLSVADDTDKAPVVYYTTDKSIPTKSSTKYTSGTKLAISNTTYLRTMAMDADGNWQRQIFKYVIGSSDTTAPVAATSPAAGTYTAAQSVTITVTDAVDTAPTVYYTTDGTTPTTSSTKYTSGTKLTISKSTTLKTLSVDASGNSKVQSFLFTINSDTTAPVLAVSPAAGSYSATQSVTLSATDDTDSAPTIYYTTDGTTPTTSSSKFTGTAISVADTGADVDMTIKAMAVDASGNQSAVASYAYSIATSSSSGTTTSTGTVYDVGLYKTNPNSQKGKYKTITVDGDASDWTSDMVIAQGVANDDPRIFRGSHEGPVYDLYSLSAAWDDTNLYLMWQFTNVTDVVAADQTYPISDNGKPYAGDIPQSIALDVDSSIGGNGTVTTGAGVWGMKHRFTNKEVDELLMFSSKPGVGTPALFKLNTTTGTFDYGTSYVTGFTTGGISFKYGDGFAFSTLKGINANGYSGYTPADLVTTSKFIDFLATTTHSVKQDTIYEMKIPLATIGITRAQLESKGIGAMVLSTFGEDTIGSLPYDPTTLDNATQPYASDTSTSAEKSDGDSFTAKFARIGN